MDTFVSDIRNAVEKHITGFGPPDAAMPYLMHWVMTFSVGDMDNEAVVYIRSVTPTGQPQYVTNGLMNEAYEIIGTQHMPDEE